MRGIDDNLERTDWAQHLEPVMLLAVGSEFESEMLIGMLTSNEIRAYSQNESSHGISHYGGQAARSSALALYRIYVHPDDEAEARSLLENVQEPEDEKPFLDEPSSDGRRWTTGVALFVLLFGFLPAGAILVFILQKLF